MITIDYLSAPNLRNRPSRYHNCPQVIVLVLRQQKILRKGGLESLGLIVNFLLRVIRPLLVVLFDGLL